jgi:hypothetical protein
LSVAQRLFFSRFHNCFDLWHEFLTKPTDTKAIRTRREPRYIVFEPPYHRLSDSGYRVGIHVDHPGPAILPGPILHHLSSWAQIPPTSRASLDNPRDKRTHVFNQVRISVGPDIAFPGRKHPEAVLLTSGSCLNPRPVAPSSITCPSLCFLLDAEHPPFISPPWQVHRRFKPSQVLVLHYTKTAWDIPQFPERSIAEPK